MLIQYVGYIGNRMHGEIGGKSMQDRAIGLTRGRDKLLSALLSSSFYILVGLLSALYYSQLTSM